MPEFIKIWFRDRAAEMENYWLAQRGGGMGDPGGVPGAGGRVGRRLRGGGRLTRRRRYLREGPPRNQYEGRCEGKDAGKSAAEEKDVSGHKCRLMMRQTSLPEMRRRRARGLPGPSGSWEECQTERFTRRIWLWNSTD